MLNIAELAGMALSKEEKSGLVKDFGVTTGNTGSVEVQVALLTSNINQLTEHCKQNPKDFSCKRGLLKLVCQRRSFLQYLNRKSVVRYRDLIKRLGLRK